VRAVSAFVEVVCSAIEKSNMEAKCLST